MGKDGWKERERMLRQAHASFHGYGEPSPEEEALCAFEPTPAPERVNVSEESRGDCKTTLLRAADEARPQGGQSATNAPDESRQGSGLSPDASTLPHPRRTPGSKRAKPKWPAPQNHSEALARVVAEALYRGRSQVMGIGFVGAKMGALGHETTMGQLRILCVEHGLTLRPDRGIVVLALDGRAREFAEEKLERLCNKRRAA